MSSRRTAVLAMDPRLASVAYPSEVRKRLEPLVDLVEALPDAGDSTVLADAELLLTGWGAPRLDEELLASMPELAAAFHAAGSVRGIVTPAFWRRGIPIVSAAAANAIPVSEFTLAHVLLGLKQAHRCARSCRADRAYPERWPVAGGYGSTVGLLALGEVGRLVAARLRTFDVRVVATDPYVTPDAATELGVRLVSLEELFAGSDVVSVHAPWLPQTEGMVTRELVASMRAGATLINTARGAVVDEPGLVDVLRERTDLTAVLDVTWPEPPSPDSPLYALPNIVLTPHIAGSMGAECTRLGALVAAEVERFVTGKPLRHVVPEDAAAVRA